MAAGDVLAHGGSCDLVVADRAHHPAPGRFQRELGEEEQPDQNHGEEGRPEQFDRNRRGRHRIEPHARRARHEIGVGLQVDLIGDGPGARDAVHVQNAAGEPFLIAQDGDDDLADTEGGDGEIVRAQAKRGLANHPGRTCRQNSAHRPGEECRQADTAEVALRRGVDLFDHRDGRIEDPAIEEETGD